MKPKISVYVGISLDGFIARTNGAVDWLDEANRAVPDGEDCGFGAFMATVDVLVLGRKTYEQVLSFGQWPCGGTQVMVLSRNPISIPEGLSATVSHSSEPPQDLVHRLSGEGVRHLYVDGGNTIQGFLAAGLVDEITVTVVPVILGGGIPLFGPLEQEIHLSHINTTVYDFGFVQTTYSVGQDQPPRV